MSPQQPNTWTASEMRNHAHLYRHDNDDGSACFFDPDQAEWQLALIDPLALGVFDSRQEAREWLDSEIAMYEADGIACEHWKQFLDDGIDEPVIVGAAEGEYGLWDGYHRKAISLIRKERLPAIVGTPIR